MVAHPAISGAWLSVGWQHVDVRFVLVHGTTQSPEGWNLLARYLTGLGATVETVDLAACGTGATSREYGKAAGAQQSARRPDVVVAHSGSGLLLPAIASAMDAKVQVYLAAFIPDGRSSLIDELAEAADKVMHEDWIGADPTTDHAAARHFLSHDCDVDDVDWAIGTLRSFVPVAVYSKVVSLAPHIPAVAVVPESDRTLRTEWMIAAAKARLGVEPVVVPGGHCPHVSRPPDLAKVLIAATSSF